MNPNRTAFKRFFVAAAIAASLSVVARAQPMFGPEAPPGMMHGHHHDMMPAPMGEGPLPPYLRGMKLSEDQQDKIFDILHAQAPQMRAHAKAVRKAHEELRALALAEQYEEGRAKTLADAAGKAMAEMALQRLRTDREILAVLTPEQRQSLVAKKGSKE